MARLPSSGGGFTAHSSGIVDLERQRPLLMGLAITRAPLLFSSLPGQERRWRESERCTLSEHQLVRRVAPDKCGVPLADMYSWEAPCSPRRQASLVDAYRASADDLDWPKPVSRREEVKPTMEGERKTMGRPLEWGSSGEVLIKVREGKVSDVIHGSLYSARKAATRTADVMAVGGEGPGKGGHTVRRLSIRPKRWTAVKKRGNPAGAMSAVLGARALLAAKRRQRRCCGCEERGVLYLSYAPSRISLFLLDSWRRFCGEFRRHGRCPPTLRGRPYQTCRPEPIRNGPGCGFVIRKMRCVAPDPDRPARSTAR
ncbi:hypothetical protein MRX96_011404 [Rhipicephalus microplus]